MSSYDSQQHSLLLATSSLDETADDDEIILTPAQLLLQLEELWLNESFAPELLENRAEIVDCVMEQIHSMQQNLSKSKKDLASAIHMLEIDRIRYVLCSYLRCRLEKIEKVHLDLMQLDDTRRLKGEPLKMTPEERIFAERYKESVSRYFEQSALCKMPMNMTQIDDSILTVKPNLNHFVFLKVKRPCESVLVTDMANEVREEIIELEADTQHIMQYKPVSILLENGSVTLI